ncbi:hypothetical protein TWF191_007344 [Orbilia oligospora]|uniref:Ecp2 effector protein domain-containing protein n=1 Tax=Orbilia oligospora TaxID=2813651 RepID=A0A7C8QRK1_ORBOL|nr:hypothetical protein TWF191_007344 [Orbilia oligospora]
MRIPIALLLQTYLIISFGRLSSQQNDEESSAPKVSAYTWIGEIKAPRRPGSPEEDICLSIDPSLTEVTLRDKKLVPRICNNVGPKWTTWRATGLLTENGKGSSKTFKGYIEHVSLGYCITYNLYNIWNMDQSRRGWLMLKNCDDLKDLTKDLDVDTMDAMQDEEYDEFINVIRLSHIYEYQGRSMREGDPDDSRLARRIFPKGRQPTVRMGENTDLVTMNINDICGQYGTYAKALEVAKRRGDDDFGLPNWSILAAYQPKDTCKSKMDPYTEEEFTICPDEWTFGCGFGTVNMDPVFGGTSKNPVSSGGSN